jgi:hypothetical protein
VAFDIDSVLGPAPAAASPGAGAGAFNIDDVLGPAPETPEAAPVEEPGYLESGLRGVKQGVTFGFGDEITGFLESAFTDKTYTQARNEARANDKAAKEAHPWVYGGGELAGGLATSLVPAGAVVKGAGFAANAVRGAGAGVLQGIGESEGETIADIAQDAGKAGLAGATIGGFLGTAGEKIFRGAPARADARLIQDLTGGRATKAGKKIFQDDEPVIAAARKFGLDKGARDVEELLPAVKAAREQVGEGIGAVYDEVDRVFLGVKAKDVAAALASVKKRYSSPAEAGARKQIDSLIEQVRDQWGSKPRLGALAKANEGAAKSYQPRVPLAKVNTLVGKLEGQGFASADLTPGAAAQLKRDLGHAVDGVLEKRMGEIQEFAGHIKATPTATNSGPLADSVTAADALKKLKGLNQDYKGLKKIEKMAEERTGVPPANRSAGGLRNMFDNAATVGSMGLSLATGNPLPYLAKAVGAPLAKGAARHGDELLRKLNIAATAGQPTARLVQQAIEAGIPRAAIVSALGPPDAPEATE